MELNRVFRGFVLSIVPLAFAATAAPAQTPDACQPFTLTADESQPSRIVEYVNLGDEGVDPGDVRIGHMPVLDAEGNAAGHYRWVARTLDGPPAAGERSEVLVNAVMRLKDGDIHQQLLIEAIRPASKTDTPSIKDMDYVGAVLGGTGAYRNARGTIERSFDGTIATYAVNISCD